MKKHAVLSAIALLVMTLATSTAGATCWTCSPTTPPNQHCVMVSSGHGACTEPYFPDDFCKLACPNCPTAPCDPGGGGSGDCKMNGITLGSHSPDQVVTTMSVLFQSDPSINAAIFGKEGSRVVTGAAFGRFTADGAAQTITEIAPKAAGRLLAVHAFSHNDNAGIGVTFENGNRERFALVGVSNGFGSQVQVNSRDESQVEKAVSVVTVGNDDVHLVSLTFGGRSYILALHTVSMGQNDANAGLRIERIKRAFENSVRAFPRPPVISGHEKFVMPVC